MTKKRKPTPKVRISGQARKRRKKSKTRYMPHELEMLARERQDMLGQIKRRAEEHREEATRLEKIAAREIELQQEYKGFVKAEPLEMLHREGTLAVERSLLRHLGDLTDRFLNRMEKAFATGGWSKLNRVAYNISRQTNTPLREVYTLYYSP